MSDLMINQAALLNRMRERLDDLKSKYGLFDRYLNGFSDAIFMVGRSQSIEAEPVRHGRWLETDYFDAHKTPIYQCSACWKEVADNYITLHKFCLHCGAKMDLEV